MTETTEAPVAAVQPDAKTPSTETNPADQESTTPTTEEKKTNGESGSPEKKAAEEKETAKEPEKEMRAVVLTGFGGFKGVKILKKPEPSIQAGEVLVRVRAW